MRTERVIYAGAATSDLSCAVQRSLEAALRGEQRIPDDLLSLVGMSGKKYRNFINGLISQIDDPRYLEVGSWSGSTLCSAIHGNDVTAMAIDNWSEYGGPSNLFFSNIGQFSTPKNRISFINSDFRSVKYSSIGKFNVYLFDGPHSNQDQYDGLYLAMPALDPEFVFIVDDWNWQGVREGSREAIKAIGAEIIYCAEIFSTEGNIHPGEIGLPTDQNSDWHNGYFIGVLRAGT